MSLKMRKAKKDKNVVEKEKKSTWYFYGIPLTWETFFKALYILSIFVAICILVENVNEWAWYSICFLCFCAWAYHKSKLDDAKNLYRNVAWISDRSLDSLVTPNLRDFELSEYIEFEQRKQNIPEEFQIDFSNETEKGNLEKILDSHKEHVIKSYFSGHLSESKEIYNMDNSEYYFFSLNNFVYANLSCYNIGEAYENKVSVSEYKFKYNLTDFGRTYYKLWLLTRLYVESNECVKKCYKYWDSTKKEYIMEELKKMKLCF